MEITLLYNKCVGFTNFKYLHDYRIDGAKDVTTMARQTGNLEIPITAKLLEDLKKTGVVQQASLCPGQSVNGPKISIGFKKLAVKSKSHNGYINISYLNLLENFFVKHVLVNNNIKFRLYIESLKHNSTEYILLPEKVTHYFVLREDWQEILSKPICFVSTTDDKLELRWVPPQSIFTKSADEWTLTVSLSLIICSKASPYEGVSDHLAVYGKMRTDEILCDTTIIAEEGGEFKCHRSVLATHSPVFAAMFETGMKEAKTGVLDLSGVSGEGIVALLDFLYVWKSDDPEQNPLVCVELLEVGHTYGIESLEKCMVEEILMVKNFDWFTPEAALRLVLYLKDVDWWFKEFDKPMKQKAIDVYKSKFKAVRMLQAYDELFKEKPEVLKTLIEFLSSG